MSSRHLRSRAASLLLALSFLWTVPPTRAQESKPTTKARTDAARRKARSEWFSHGRVVPGQSSPGQSFPGQLSAELRRRSYQAKMRMRALAQRQHAESSVGESSFVVSWTALGPVPLASDATGTGLQDYHQVAGRATAVAIDPADPTGNTVYIGSAQGGVWKSSNAAASNGANVTWTALTDDQPTLAIGALAIQSGNSAPTKSVILAATGEANNADDSYFGLGILRSSDAGATWSLASTANNGTLSFSGLGATRMTFGGGSTAVVAMATDASGVIEASANSSITPGLYTSLDAGQSWTSATLLDSSQPADSTSATSVVYNAFTGTYFAALRYHGFYSSSDGVTWNRLSVQPGGTLLGISTCPPQSSSNRQICPMVRGEITTVPGRNEMYVWFVSLDATGAAVDQGIWQSLNGGLSWSAISDSGVTNCGDLAGCGVAQGVYDLELLAVPNCPGGAQTCSNSPTDLYAGAENLYKCSITSATSAPTCNSAGFINLTHVYGCDPVAAPAHVHPDQHALALMVPSAGTETGDALLYFANDGGIYRALNGFSGLTTGSCSGTNQFDDLNQNLGSLTQFVGFSQDPVNPDNILGGAQNNGSPATSTATATATWSEVNSGEGGFTAIDATARSDWFISNPDIAPGGLNIQSCPNGANCHEQDFAAVVNSSNVGGDDGAFFVPYILDPQSSSALLVGTCRVWRGSRFGGAHTVLSPNFDTFGSGLCTGNEVNLVRSLAAGGALDNNGSMVIYATTDGPGPASTATPVGGHVWVTTNASTGPGAFEDVTQAINPNHFPVSTVATDALDATGNTAFVGIMGFTGGPGHIWKTQDAGANWTDFTGTGDSSLPDAPVNALVVDSATHTIYAGTDVGIFQSDSITPAWSEVGPASSSGPGFLPNVSVTALGIFSTSTQKFLRASTYGRGLWQYNLNPIADFQLAVSNPEQTIFVGPTPVFNGTVASVNGYASPVNFICVSGATNPPVPCTVTPATLTPGNNTPFTLTTTAALGDYSFYVQADGSDANNTTHKVLLALHIVSFGLTTPSPASVSAAHGTTSPPVNFQVTAAGPFNQSVAISCGVNITGATCNLTPGTSVNPTSSVPVAMTATVTTPLNAVPGAYPVTILATTAGAATPLTTSFALNVTSNPDFVLSEPTAFPVIKSGNPATGSAINIASQDGFSSSVNLTCSLNSANGSCSFNPTSVSSYPATASVSVNATTLPAGSYQLTVQGTSGATTHTLSIPVNVGDYQLTGPTALAVGPGIGGTANLTFTASAYYNGSVNATCDVSSLPKATCSLSLASPIALTAGEILPFTALINVPNDASAGSYSVKINTADTGSFPAHNLTIPLTVGQDYTIGNLSPQNQTISAGQSAPYNFNVLPVGSSYGSSITLSCIIFPPTTTGKCSFSPSVVPPLTNSTAVAVVMTVTTKAATATARPPTAPTLGWALLWLPLGTLLLRSGTRRRSRLFFFTIALAALTMLPSCGGGSNGGGGGPGTQGTPPGTYSISVIGSPASTGQTVPPTATLTVQ